MKRKLELYFIRHGATDWNKYHRVMGTSPIPLNEAGREEVRVLAGELADREIPVIYTSNVVRAMETAEILAMQWDAEVLEEPALNESKFEQWVGKNYIDLGSDPDFKLYRSRPTRSNFSESENMNDIQKRVMSAVRRVESEAEGLGRGGNLEGSGTSVLLEEGGFDKAAIVSHRDVIKPAVAYFLGMELDYMHRIDISNASVTLVEKRSDSWWVVRYLNYAPRKW